MATGTDLYNKRILFSDGEGIDPADFNNLQKYLLQRNNDNEALSLIPDCIDAPNVLQTHRGERSLSLNEAFLTPDDLVFTTHPGSGFWYPGGSANTLVLCPGPISTVQETPATWASPTGDSVMITARLGDWFGTPLTLTTAVGHATLPRIDMVEVKLEYINNDTASRDFKDATTGAVTTTTPSKSRRVQVTYQIVQGTPAADPVYPACTSGFRPWAAVRIPATHNAVHATSNLRDMRMPLGNVRVLDVPANQAWVPGANPWVITQGNPNAAMYAAAPGSGTGTLHFPCPTGSAKARVIGLGLYSYNVSSGAVLQRVLHQLPGVPAFTLLADFNNPGGGTSGYSMTGAAAGYREWTLPMLQWELGAQSAIQGIRTGPNTTRIGSPIWCNGYSAGVAVLPTVAQSTMAQLVLSVASSSGGIVSFARWIIAEGR